jgi:hypothetical protein
MKLIRSILISSLLVAAASVAQAQNFTDMGVLAGLRLNDGTSRSAGTGVDGAGTFQIGGLAFMPLSERFSLRTGFIYAQRNYETTAGGNTSDVEYAHFDVPVTFMYRLSDMGGIFFGPGVALKVKDDCGGQDCEGAESMLIPVSFGGHFKIAPQVAAEFYYETAPGKLDNGIKDPSAVVFNAIITFE